MATMRHAQHVPHAKARSWLDRPRRFAGWLVKPQSQLRWWRVVVALTLSLGVLSLPAIGVFIWAAYTLPGMDWTGFAGNTYYQWMNLLLVPVALSAGTIWYTYSHQGTATPPIARKPKDRGATHFWRVMRYTWRRFWRGKDGIEPLALLLVGVLALADVLLVFFGVVLLVLAIWVQWGWTGYQGKALWDWLENFLEPAAILFATIWISAYKTRSQRKHAR